MINDIISALKPFAGFQNVILDASEDNVSEITMVLESMTDINVSEIVYSLISLVQIRPNSTKTIPLILQALKSENLKREIIKELMSLAFFVNNDDGNFGSNITPLLILKSLTDAGMVSVNKILEKINSVPSSSISHMQLFFLFFRKHIQQNDPDLFKRLISVNPQTSCGWTFNDRFNCILDSLESNYDYIFEVGYPRNSIEAAIKLDDIKTFIEFTAVPEFNICSEFKYDIFYVGDEISASIPSLAAHYGSVQIFKYCVINKYDLNFVPKEAVFGGNLEIIHILEHENASFLDTLAPAAAAQRIEILEWIMQSPVSQKLILQNEIEQAAIAAANTGSANSLIFCFENGAKVTPSLINSSLEHINILKALLKSNEISLNEPDDHNQTPIFMAAALGYEDAFDILLATGKIDINDPNMELYPQCSAALAGRMGILKRMNCIQGINWNVSSPFTKETPLMMAAGASRLDVVKFLLNIDSVNTELVSNQDNTALHIAAIAGNFDVIKALAECPRVNKKAHGFRGRMASELAKTEEIANYLKQFETN